jgi:hypothetical protein
VHDFMCYSLQDLDRFHSLEMFQSHAGRETDQDDAQEPKVSSP